MSNVEWIKIHTDDKYIDKFSANTLNAKSIVSNNIVGPFGPITGLVSYSTATATMAIPAQNTQIFMDINNISNPGGVILASNFTNGAIFEAYLSGRFNHVSGGFVTQVKFGLSFNTLNAADMRIGHTPVNSVNNIAPEDTQIFEYRCTFRVVSYTNSTITIAFVTSAQITVSADIVASPTAIAAYQLNQVSRSETIDTTDRTLNGNINLIFYAENFSRSAINFSRYTSYIKRIV